MTRLSAAEAGRRFAALPGAARAGAWMTSSAVAFVAALAIGKHLAPEIHVVQIAFLRNFFGLLFMLPWLARAGGPALRTPRAGRHLLRGALSSVNATLLFAAAASLPLADMSAIHFLQPVIGAAVAVAFLGERADRRRWLAICCGFAGALVVIRPGFAEIPWGVLFALGSAAVGAVVTALIKTLARTDPPDAIAAWLFVTQTGFLAVPAALVWTNPRWETWALLAAMGLIGVGLQRAYNRGIQAADVSVALPFNFTRLIWAALLGWVAFGDVPDAWTWAGGAVIFAASLGLARSGRGAPRRLTLRRRRSRRTSRAPRRAP